MKMHSVLNSVVNRSFQREGVSQLKMKYHDILSIKHCKHNFFSNSKHFCENTVDPDQLTTDEAS